MAKLKTHKSTAKRFKVTKTGKLAFSAPGFNHLRSKMDARARRRQVGDRILKSNKVRRLKKLMPGVSTK